MKKKKKEEAEKGVKEEAPRAWSKSEALNGGGSPVGSGCRYESSCFPCTAHALNPDYEHCSENGDAQDDGWLLEGDVESGEKGAPGSDFDQLLPHGASLAVPMASTSMSPVSPSQQLLPPSSDTPSSDSVQPSASPMIVPPSGSLPSAVMVTDSNGRPDGEQREILLGLPSVGRIAEDTYCLLKDCQLSVKWDNPRQCFAEIPQLCNLQVLFQRPEDIVEKLLSGHLDIGIVGLDTVSEYGQGDEDLIMVHDALGYGHCHLSLAIPKDGIFEKINSVKELAQMPQWTEEEPLRVATGFTYLGTKFMKENGVKHVIVSGDEGELEAALAMGTADVILDLVDSGTTLGDNNLKELEGGTVLKSQAVLVASRKSLVQREGVLDTTHEILGRLEAHFKAVGQFMVTANMRGSSAEEVAERVLSQPSLSGLQGPAVSRVFCKHDGVVDADCYAIAICVPEKLLRSFVQQLKAIGGSEVLTSPLTYIFDEETSRWQQLLSKLGL